MKTPLDSKTLNSSTAYVIACKKDLGWQAMPTFPEVQDTNELTLGWHAMSAFGESRPAHVDKGEFTELRDMERPTHQPQNSLLSFWSALSCLA